MAGRIAFDSPMFLPSQIHATDPIHYLFYSLLKFATKPIFCNHSFTKVLPYQNFTLYDIVCVSCSVWENLRKGRLLQAHKANLAITLITLI